jgi:hypothetical protein
MEIDGTKRDLENAQKHTRLPWHFSRKFRYVSDTNHKVIAEISPLVGFEANAAFIVRAVNSHDALVASLEEMMGVYWGDGDGELPEPGCILRARAALAAAKATQ